MNLADLTTEGRNPNSTHLDRLSAEEIVRLMSTEDATVPAAVARVAGDVARSIELIADRLRAGGRLIYIGAGTSGRLGVLDAAECPPTFNSPPWQVVGLIAGGHSALTRAIEGAEDHEELGARDLQSIDCSSNDVVVGIATSGRTPYVIGGMKYARTLGCTVIGLSCNQQSQLATHCDIEIVPIVGPEVVTGSTRLKAGTATKLVLNMLSTGAMVLLGKTYGNLMVDLQSTNQKLADRSKRIVAELAKITRTQAAALLRQSHHDVKTAITAHHWNVPADVARRHLQESNGQLRAAISNKPDDLPPDEHPSAPALVLGVDGGGTKTLAWLARLDDARDEPVGVGSAGPSNPTSIGSTAALANLELAIRRAFEAAGCRRQAVAAACLAIAGTGSEERQAPLKKWSETHGLAEALVLTHDLLPVLAAGTDDCCGIALVSGTGSIAFGRNHTGESARAGGWGHRLSDQGSGYDIAIRGLRAIVEAHDGIGPPTTLTTRLLAEWELDSVDDLVRHLAREKTAPNAIAQLAPAVMEEATSGDGIANRIIDHAAAQLAQLVEIVATKRFDGLLDIPLVLSGGVLTQTDTLRQRLLQTLRSLNVPIGPIAIAEQPVRGAIRLAKNAATSTAHENQT